MSNINGKLYIVGIGPGPSDLMTPRALKGIIDSTHILGYGMYLKLIESHTGGKEIINTGMTFEVDRAKKSVELANQGKTVSLISSGDPGVYAMASLVFDILREIDWDPENGPEVEVVPGVTAANSCASLVGAPLGHDACTISLSDLLTPWSLIKKRIELAADADFVISFYNPASKKRKTQIYEARDILLKYRNKETPVAIITSAYRDSQKITVTTLGDFLNHEVGMTSTVIIGSSITYSYNGVMVTPRGYSNKYKYEDGSVLEGQRRGLSLKE